MYLYSKDDRCKIVKLVKKSLAVNGRGLTLEEIEYLSNMQNLSHSAYAKITEDVGMEDVICETVSTKSKERNMKTKTLSFWGIPRIIWKIRKIGELYQILVELIDYVNKARKDPKLNLIVDRIDKLVREIVG